MDLPYCRKCGAEIPGDAKYCPSCGAPTTPEVKPRREREEKYEKYEKHEKHEKREKEEKHEKAEKRERDRLGSFMGGLILILLGITFYLAQTGQLTWRNWWAYFIFGMGVILLLMSLIRATSTAYRGPYMGYLLGGIVLVILGLSGIAGIREWWPLLIIALGILIIIYGISAAQRSPRPG